MSCNHPAQDWRNPNIARYSGKLMLPHMLPRRQFKPRIKSSRGQSGSRHLQLIARNDPTRTPTITRNQPIESKRPVRATSRKTRQELAEYLRNRVSGSCESLTTTIPAVDATSVQFPPLTLCIDFRQLRRLSSPSENSITIFMLHDQAGLVGCFKRLAE
jgi:hypothetical protein